ncbi:hypothetical protein OPS25_02410 [Alteromonas ponticola]|uniref:Uncharacterized protein n=1 Tax=Alteromonas aquimaris TaxID=2998417 RepID=A0ABT3P3M8_9ALTE|nr:hypothetical protein [Alteromonas aquimaris]MCW8107353.1 hypothetical protein [Alteromonas aquimaris]
MNTVVKKPRYSLSLCMAILVGSASLMISIPSSAGSSSPSLHARSTDLAKIRASTNQFKKIENALGAGYISSIDLGAGCSTAESEGHPSQLGAMGIHLVDLQDFGSPEFDFHNPSVLVYVPKSPNAQCSYTTDELMNNKSCRDNLSLAAVEEVVFAHLIDVEEREGYWDNVPTFHEQQFYYLHDNPSTFWVDEAHGFPPHYALHIWLFKHNPAGLFAPWNPRVKCPDSLSHH